VLSRQFALALTLYSAAMHSLLYYVRVPWCARGSNWHTYRLSSGRD